MNYWLARKREDGINGYVWTNRAKQEISPFMPTLEKAERWFLSTITIKASDKEQRIRPRGLDRRSGKERRDRFSQFPDRRQVVGRRWYDAIELYKDIDK